VLRCGGPPVRASERRDAARQAVHMLRLGEPFEEFHALCRSVPGYAWVPASRAGRLLRSPDPFEDLVKLVCTTNCTWALTKVMISGLVEGLGEPVAGVPGRLPEGARRAFPRPAAMAAAPPSFYARRVRAGYRAPALRDLARRVATGGLDPLAWLEPAADPDAIAREILSVRGAGRYVAENMLKLLGRYDGLGLDSWCRRKFAEIHGRGRPVSDRTIARHYARFGRWRGLALWCDLTRDWCEDAGSGLEALRQGKY
jgi:3-methyladenine DNA glycosylase/8-oxoguanine DNA glycosylase